MNNDIIESIERGRRAVALAKEEGRDTTEWERRLAELQREHLMGWASQLAESTVELVEPVVFIEAPLREITTTDVTTYARRYLKTIGYSRLQQCTGGCANWTPDWWKDREEDAIAALKGIFEAMNENIATNMAGEE